MPPSPSETDLTPLRAHYLKKSLIQLQFAREFAFITSQGPTNVSTLSYLGSPFSPPPKDAPPVDLPFLCYIFRQFVLTFPFMAAAPKDFYSQKLQPFVAAVVSRNLTSTSVFDDGTDAEQASRKKILKKFERNLSLFMGKATKLVEHEEVVRLTQSDLDRLDLLSKKRQARLAKIEDLDVFEVNIVSVRTVLDKGRIRNRIHDEFIIRTRRSRYPDVFVSRRYGDFKTLASELAKAHPEESIRLPPAKDRTYVMAPSSFPNGSRSQPVSPLTPGRESTMSTFNDHDLNSEHNYSTVPSPSRLAREKNRLTLRSYLHSLLASSTIGSSPVLRSFLLSGPTTLSPEELEDAKSREEADNAREEGRKKFAKEIAARIDALRGGVKNIKSDIMGEVDGLTHIFGIVRATPDITNLPPNFQAVVEWARISVASTVYHHYVATDDASESFAGLKRIHGLMPYFMLKAALKISNPISMIRSILDLFLAQPFGGRSLMQRMFTSSLAEEVKVLEAEIESVKDKVDDPVMCAKVRQFVYAPREIQAMFKDDAASEGMNLITIVLRSSEEPVLSRVQMHRLARAQKAHTIYMKNKATLEDSDDDDGPQDEDAWLLEDLKILTKLYSRLREREQLIELIFEGFTAELLKDIITIFYSPLAQVYRAANIADSLGDLQTFINDLIKTVEQVEELSQEDPHQTVQAFINLIQRHEQSFYYFVHKVHSKGDELFDSLMKWIELFLTIVREGLKEPISLEYLLPHTGKERDEIMTEVDKVALYHYKLKLLYENKLRRRFGRANGQSQADADEATQTLINGFVGDVNLGELTSDTIDMAAEVSDEEVTDEEESDSEGSSTSESTGGEDESDEGEHEGSGPLNGKAMAVSPSQSTSNKPDYDTDSGSFQRSAPQALRSSPPSARPRPTVLRKKSLSLKKSKSMSLSMSNLSFSRGSDAPVPPLLRSKTFYPPVPSSKPLPLDPTLQGATEELPPPPTPPKDTPFVQQQPPQRNKPSLKSKPKKKPQQTLKPPELEHIPKLLPVFAEIMRPLLLVRKGSSS